MQLRGSSPDVLGGRIGFTRVWDQGRERSRFARSVVGRLVWGEGFQRRERGEGAGGATAAHKSQYLQRKHEYTNRRERSWCGACRPESWTYRAGISGTFAFLGSGFSVLAI